MYGYIREAILGSKGWSIARKTEKLGALERSDVVGRITQQQWDEEAPAVRGIASAMADVVTEQVFRQVLPRVLQKVPKEKEITNEILSQVDARLSRTKRDH